MRKARVLPLMWLAWGPALALPEYGILVLDAQPAPQLVYDTPRLGRPEAAARAPLYLHVPRDHGKQWSRYCAQYQACDRPAYFVSDEWYYGTYLGHALPPELDPEESLAPEVARGEPGR